MLAFPIRKALPPLALVAAAWALGVSMPVAGQAQVREVVSKEISVGRTSAEMRLEFSDGRRLEVALDDGSVLIDGRSVGSYEPGGTLDVAWRGLLGQAVALDDGPLAQALADWQPPAGLQDQVASAALRIDRALEGAATPAEASVDRPAAATGDAQSMLRFLLGSPSRLRQLQEAVSGISPGAQVHASEDVVVGAEDVVSGDLIVIDGDVRIEGSVRGDVVVVGGSLELVEGSSVSGGVRLVDAELVRNRGTVGDEVVDVDVQEQSIEDEIRDQIRDDVRREMRVELRDRERGSSLLAPFRPIIRGVGGVLENLVAIFVLALIGAGVIAFGGDKVDVIAETAKRSPGRAAAVGMAATVLLIPVWVLGFVALLVSIIGIPVAIAWLPLFPLAAAAAGLVGYLAVARNTGEWLSDSDYPWTHWIRKSNTLVTTVGGLAGLMLLFVAANVISMAPFLRVLSGLLVAAGCIVTVLALEVGLGAVILTRAGRRRDPWFTSSADAAWEAAMRVDVDDVGVGEARDVRSEGDDSGRGPGSGTKGDEDA